jgi:hypothetical protein
LFILIVKLILKQTNKQIKTHFNCFDSVYNNGDEEWRLIAVTTGYTDWSEWATQIDSSNNGQHRFTELSFFFFSKLWRWRKWNNKFLFLFDLWRWRNIKLVLYLWIFPISWNWKVETQSPKFQKVWDIIPKSHTQVPTFQKDWDFEA